MPRTGERVQVGDRSGAAALLRRRRRARRRPAGDRRQLQARRRQAVIAPLLLATQLVVWHSYRADEQRALEQCVAVWNRAHADVAGRGAGAALRRLRVEAGGGDPARQRARPRHLRPQRRIGDWARAGLIEPLADTLPARRVPRRHRRRRCASSGKLWGVPLAFKSLALFYRKRSGRRAAGDDRRAGGAGPAHQGDQPAGHYALAYEAGSVFYHAPWLHGFGGQLLDGTRPARARQPEARSRRWRSCETLAADELLPPESTGVGRDAAVQRRARRASPSTDPGSSARSRPACPSAWRRCRR